MVLPYPLGCPPLSDVIYGRLVRSLTTPEVPLDISVYNTTTSSLFAELEARITQLRASIDALVEERTRDTLYKGGFTAILNAQRFFQQSVVYPMAEDDKPASLASSLLISALATLETYLRESSGKDYSGKNLCTMESMVQKLHEGVMNRRQRNKLIKSQRRITHDFGRGVEMNQEKQALYDMRTNSSPTSHRYSVSAATTRVNKSFPTTTPPHSPTSPIILEALSTSAMISIHARPLIYRLNNASEAARLLEFSARSMDCRAIAAEWQNLLEHAWRVVRGSIRPAQRSRSSMVMRRALWEKIWKREELLEGWKEVQRRLEEEIVDGRTAN